MEYSIYDRILGGLVGAGTGDAMGAATEARTTEQIREYFGHLVTDFETPPMDTFGAGNKPGQFTDDFSSAFFLAKSIVDNQGVVDQKAVQKALINWSEHTVFLIRCPPHYQACHSAFQGGGDWGDQRSTIGYPAGH